MMREALDTFDKEERRFKISSTALFILFSLCHCVIQFLNSTVVLTKDIYEASLRDQLEAVEINSVLNKTWEWTWYAILLSPVALFIKFVLVSSCLATSAFFLRIRLEFKLFFRIAILGEIAFFLSDIYKIIWFSSLETQYTLTDVHEFSPLSMMSIVGTERSSQWWMFGLRQLNLFQILYIILLALALQRENHQALEKNLTLTLSGYGIGLLIWITLVSFLTLQVA